MFDITLEPAAFATPEIQIAPAILNIEYNIFVSQDGSSAGERLTKSGSTMLGAKTEFVNFFSDTGVYVHCQPNGKLKRIIADQALDIIVLKDINSKKW